GEEAVRLPEEAVDRAFQLASQPARRLFAGALDRAVELDGRRLRDARRRAFDDPLQLVELPTLDLAEPSLDAAQRLRLLALDLLLQAALADAQALADLVEGPPPLCRMRLELRARRLDGLLCQLLELDAQLRHLGALLLACGLQALRVGCEAGL